MEDFDSIQVLDLEQQTDDVDDTKSATSDEVIMQSIAWARLG